MKLKFTLGIFLVFAGFSAVHAQKLWGVTSSGVADNKGVVFNANNDGTGYTVQNFFNSDAPGSNPYNSLTLAGGKLYGMTYAGGASDLGIIFEYDPSNGNYVKKFDFDGTTNGSRPKGGFVLASNGLLYGMTSEGGANGKGILFSYSPGATAITKTIDFNGTNGSTPLGSLMQASNTHLFGVTSAGGSGGSGVLFEYTIATSTLTVRWNFSASTDGATPSGDLIEVSGKLYGLAPEGGFSATGTLFEYVIASTAFTKKVDFTGTNGLAPYGSLVANAGGTLLFGMTSGGGTSSKGTIFSYVPGDPTVSVQISLDVTVGNVPLGSLMRASNGMYYGMTLNGGASNYGVIFEYDGASGYSQKFDFDPDVSGGNPLGTLTEAGGILYGLATFNGPAGNGTLFQFNQTTSTFTKKVDFSNASQGSNPLNGLTPAPNGMLYGATSAGGVNGFGTIYESITSCWI